ncbi:MAG: hypothetical protein LUE98_14440 [Tannerellaceae bacterium]|nr:hypothetical protein [Tannerellaceae bacterium]
MNNIKMHTLLLTLLCSFSICSCDDYTSPDINQGLDEENSVSLYMEQYDPIANVGQYTFPEMTVKPKKYWTCVEVLNVGSRNELGWTEEIRGLQYHLMCQSLAGLTNRAVQEGRSEIAVWLHDHGSREAYNVSAEALKNMGVSEQGMQSGLELARNNYGESDGVHIQLKNLFDGYILTDVQNNPESNIVASIASHVYNSIIVDIRDKEYYEEAGYTLQYDARNKTTADAWKEFKNNCNNKGLVVMPVQTGEMRDFAIMNGYFVLNINKQHGTASAGQNLDIFEEILNWLEPGAPIYGWEQGIDEEVFVNRASKTGHVWVPCDWCYNLPLTSLMYKSRQTSVLARVDNPQFIDYEKKKNFISFFLSDGDNIQWMMNDFNSGYYSHEYANEMKIGFGMPIGNLAMLAPAQFSNLVNQQKTNYTLIEALGGGYLYVDNYGEDNNRATRLKELAGNVAASMRQHRVKVLGVMAKDLTSPAALEGFQAFVDANDQLEGIVAIQYSPYAGGKGEIYWVTNKNGEDIPVITAKYSLWNFGNYNTEREGTPAYIANKLKAEAGSESHSLICLHAWSNFNDLGKTTDEVAENQDGNHKGAGAAGLLINHLGDNFEVVSVQELIWRVRMAHREEQTIDWLNRVF